MPSTPSEAEGIDTPRVLVIEDLRVFRFPCVYARTVPAAAKLLFNQSWDEVWFDYDMASTMEDWEKPTGTTTLLVRRMERMAHEGTILPIGRIYVHTMNPEGRAEIVGALSRWYELRVVQANDYLADGETPMEWVGHGR